MQDQVPYKSKLLVFDRIILSATYCLYPVGVIMALIRVLSTHFHHSCRGRNHKLLGWVFVCTYLLLMGLFYITYDEFGPAEAQQMWDLALIFGVLLIVPAIVFAFLASRADHKFNILLRQYYELVMERGITEIDHLAVAVKQSPYHVMRDLDFMITTHRLPFGRIEQGVLEIEPEGFHEGPREEPHDPPPSPEVRHEPAAGPRPPQGPRSMECPGCGARIVVNANERKECEYCGNVIVA
ncbi:hypothetical protein GRF59_11795 [Paenibacillus sp. HJL G12]|uniref:Uncharacterized protein n=1 Tax=Paenibacillus dendrobii TaxID=2691084 RepID=A0A7X3II07_9BACL|nr:hypothetical protein [Paenibacillus dendrobii]MWV44313.1 hypothetical protein [Paenibacillus dendrobii]